MSRATAIKVGRVVFAVVVVAFLAKVALDNAHQLRHVDLHVRVVPLLVAAPLVVLAGLLLPLGWRRLVSAWGPELTTAVALRIWVLSQASRYVVTGVATVASRTALAARAGVARSLAAASTAIEIGVLVVVAAAFAAACLPSRILAAPLRIVAFALAVAALLALPALLRLGGRVLHRLEALRPDALRAPRLYQAIAIDAASIAVRSTAFVFFALGLLPGAHRRDALLLAGALQGAAVIGLVGVTPAGLGVREGVLAGLLHADGRFPLGDAAAVAVAWRAYEFAFELAWVGLAAAIGRTTQVRGRSADKDERAGEEAAEG